MLHELALGTGDSVVRLAAASPCTAGGCPTIGTVLGVRCAPGAWSWRRGIIPGPGGSAGRCGDSLADLIGTVLMVYYCAPGAWTLEADG